MPACIVLCSCIATPLTTSAWHARVARQSPRILTRRFSNIWNSRYFICFGHCVYVLCSCCCCCCCCMYGMGVWYRYEYVVWQASFDLWLTEAVSGSEELLARVGWSRQRQLKVMETVWQKNPGFSTSSRSRDVSVTHPLSCVIVLQQSLLWQYVPQFCSYERFCLPLNSRCCWSSAELGSAIDVVIYVVRYDVL